MLILGKERSPGRVKLSFLIIIVELVEEDISSHWHKAIHDGNGDYISIELHQDHLGKCYESFWDRHGLCGRLPSNRKHIYGAISKNR